MDERETRPATPPLLHRSLLLRTNPPAPEGAVLLLHGGRADGLARPARLNLPDLRMRPFAGAVLRQSAGRPVTLGLARYRHRGWNGTRADTVRDAEAAIDELAAVAGPVPLVLVGHSMGARAGLRAGGHPQVRGVVALAPWCPPDEPVEHLAGTSVVLLHADRDRITDPRGSLLFARRARRAGAHVCRIVVNGSDHAMLRRAADWHALTGRLVAGLLGYAELPAKVAAALEEGADDAGLDLAVPAVGG